MKESVSLLDSREQNDRKLITTKSYFKQTNRKVEYDTQRSRAAAAASQLCGIDSFISEVEHGVEAAPQRVAGEVVDLIVEAVSVEVGVPSGTAGAAGVVEVVAVFATPGQLEAVLTTATGDDVLHVLDAPLVGDLVEVVGEGEAGLGGLAETVLDVLAGEVHGEDDLVEGDDVRSVADQGVLARVHGAAGGHGVTLDAGDLDQALDGVAGQAQVVLHGDLGGVLDLEGGAAVQEAVGGGGHGAGGADLGLAAGLGAGDGGVDLGHVAHEARHRERVDDVIVGDVGDVVAAVVEHGGHDSAGAAGGRGDHGLGGGGVVLADGEGVGEEQLCPLGMDGEGGAYLAVGGRALRLDVGLPGLPGEVEAAGDDAAHLEALLDALLHGVPALGEVVADVLVLGLVDVVGERLAVLGGPLADGVHRGEVVHLVEGLLVLARELGDLGGDLDGAAADRVVRLAVQLGVPGVGVQRHAVDVEEQHLVGAPVELHGQGVQALDDGHVGHVALAGGREAAVQRADHAIRALAVVLAEVLGRVVGAHGVGARRAEADPRGRRGAREHTCTARATRAYRGSWSWRSSRCGAGPTRWVEGRTLYGFVDNLDLRVVLGDRGARRSIPCGTCRATGSAWWLLR